MLSACSTKSKTSLINQSLLERAQLEAEGYLELGMTEHALAALERRPDLVQRSSRGCYLLGESLRELHRYEEAINPLRRGTALAPEEMHNWLALGWCYKRIGKLKFAIESLEHALEHEPREAILHYNLACYWSLAHDPSRALDYLAKALHLDINFRDMVDAEPDFDPIRCDPSFQLLTTVVV